MGAVGSVVLPILVLVAVLCVYGMTRQPDSRTPTEFAPIAGAWVGPIVGFLATMAFAFWSAKRAGGRSLRVGATVGVLSALFDYIVGIFLLGAPVRTLDLLCYGFRIVAGLGGGWLGATLMHIHRRTEIACSPATLWLCLTDMELLKRWITQLVDETLDDPSRSGLGALSTVRIREGNKVVAYRCVVTAWEPARRLAIRLSGGLFAEGMEMDVTYDLSHADGATTILDYDVSVPLKGMLFRVMGPIIWLASAGSANRDMAKLQVLAQTMNA
jgi:uncharacterized protein YndB with AHSA1/START domain